MLASLRFSSLARRRCSDKPNTAHAEESRGERRSGLEVEESASKLLLVQLSTGDEALGFLLVVVVAARDADAVVVENVPTE